MIERRGLIGGLAGLLVTSAIIRTPGLLMPIKVQRLKMSYEAQAICRMLKIDPSGVREMPGTLYLSASAYSQAANATGHLFSRTVAEPTMKGFLAGLYSYELILDAEMPSPRYQWA